MFSEFYFTNFNTAQIAMHSQVERWIVIFSCAEKLINGYIYSKFLSYFALKGIFGAFVGFNLTTWKLPHTFKFTISALRGKICSITMQYCCNNFYLLHLAQLLSYPLKIFHQIIW